MPAPDTELGPRRQALLVAGSTYTDPSFTWLTAPPQDVEALESVLADTGIGGFEVVQPSLINQSKQAVEEGIYRFFKSSRPQDELLLYLSGHGVLGRDSSWYFATKDTRPDDLPITAVSDGFIRDAVNKHARAQSIAVIVDCCHSGAAAKGFLAKGSSREVHLPRRLAAGQGKVILTASDEWQAAYEDGGSSLFTRFMVEGLRDWRADSNRDGYISISELKAYVTLRLADAADVGATPLQVPGLAGHTHGEFFIAVDQNCTLVTQDVRQALGSTSRRQRIAAVGDLEDMRVSGDHAQAAAADQLLGRLAVDEDPEVQRLARAALQTPSQLATADESRDARGTSRGIVETTGQDESPDALGGARVAARQLSLASPERLEWLEPDSAQDARARDEEIDSAESAPATSAAKRGARAFGRFLTVVAEGMASTGGSAPATASDGPATGGAFQRAGQAHETRGEVAEAEDAYHKALELGHTGAALGLGRLLESRGDLDGAEAAYRRADSHIHPSAAQALDRIAQRRLAAPADPDAGA